MRYSFFYGLEPKFTQGDAPSFSNGRYECCLLLQNRHGDPVAVSRQKDLDIWRVQCGFSAVFFATYEDAMAFCRGRFLDLDGKAV